MKLIILHEDGSHSYIQIRFYFIKNQSVAINYLNQMINQNEFSEV